MRRAIFAMLVGCGASSPKPTTVELVQPLPSVTASASSRAPVVLAQATRDDDDPRDLRDPPRPQKILQNESALLERLVATMATTASDRPTVLLRLAESYADLGKWGDTSASAKAIARYAEIVSAYPSYARIDEARYYLALEYEHARDLPQARRAYYELIKSSPSSRFVPYAYFAFGEMFFAEAKGDPSKWALAEQAYAETMKFSTSPIANVATCKLAAVLDAEGEPQRAAQMRQRAHACGGG